MFYFVHYEGKNGEKFNARLCGYANAKEVANSRLSFGYVNVTIVVEK